MRHGMTLLIFGILVVIQQYLEEFRGRYATAQVDYSQFVNPLIGSEGPYPGEAFGGGDILVGGAVPFGDRATLNGGFTPNGKVTAISMMHESGTGGPPKYGVIAQMPLTTIKAPVNILDNTTYWQRRVGNDVAQVNYFSTELADGIKIELSGARHSGILQYTFPDGERHVLVDVSHYLPDGGFGGSSIQYYLGGEINLKDNGIYTGYGTYGGGFNEGAPMTVHFCGDFETPPTKSKTFKGRNTDPMQRQHNFANGGPQLPIFGGQISEQAGLMNDRVGAVFSWDSSSPNMIRSRVGISFISTDKACRFKDDEIPSYDLQQTVDAGRKEWNEEVFSKIQVDTGESANQTNLILLYSSLYFMHLMPSNREGENPLWKSDEPSWDDFYAIWDIFRCTVSLYHLIQPTAYESMIRSLIDIWRYDGFMPDGRSGNWNGLTQGGSNADNVLADAYVKGLRGGINWTEGYAAMVKDAERKEGRGALYDWIPLGYVSSDRSTRCISRTVEYSLNDFSLYQVAQGEAPGDASKYLNRSANWQNIWVHDLVSVNTTESFKGFMAPRLSSGEFNLTNYNPAICDECSWRSVTYEEYSFTIPHDAETLIEFMGGAADFERRLDYIFEPNSSQANLGANGAGINTIMNIGNEPDFATPYLYNYINKQYKSVERSRYLGNRYFKNANYGVPGNSDAGALNSWLIWQMIGMYPIVTQPVYLLESPWFSDINMTINHDKILRISTTNLGQESFYVQSVRLNGQRWNKNWFEHTDVMVDGGTIEFELGPEPIIWESGSVPPSPGHVEK
ncbi:glycosyl hydrolase [Pseudovirgaria hyperparasitica]|uniref:Glycosyl hydrolase n=1 Tax=Pseudovirgaria hyperparasitica TaxID=470096 RepID=A0A6A6VX29_9PEZI|nr:glycosyl hydrolase [Pseudovirgaria hyperparasitica]KAF2754356.1 glycosyl hydrolase [Pseudovirgaria hyperparasitica]